MVIGELSRNGGGGGLLDFGGKLWMMQYWVKTAIVAQKINISNYKYI
jgi:hypothetical protein